MPAAVKESGRRTEFDTYDAGDSDGDGSDGVLDFCWAQVVKYLWRMPHKGSPLVDARKADFYLHHLINKLEQSE